MKKHFTLWFAMLLALMLAGTVYAEEAEQTDAEAFEEEDIFADWNKDAPALQTLIDYVETVTDESSEDFIPKIDRIAVFDMDGTIYAELFPTYLEYYAFAWKVLKDPDFEPDEDMLEVARTIRECALDKSYPDEMPVMHGIQAARAYAGLTLDEFSDYVTEILLREADGFEGMTYGEAFYSPILEVIEYLVENDFKVYIVSGSDRYLCRTLFEGFIEIPDEQIIGMDVAVKASGQGDTDGLDYVYTDEDTVIRTDQLQIKNLKMNKVCQIVKEIGRQPVISFGNTSGDVSMHNYTIDNNRYKSVAFMLIADDEERDYGNYEKAQSLREEWEKDGYNVISMRDDFRTIYGDDVVKTGSFHWLEELADDRGNGTEASTEASSETTSDTDSENASEVVSDIQFVMYCGTNDKDTGEPFGDRIECQEKAKEILIDCFGGYTIQDAEGGWIDDDGKEYQEYSMVIYLSDTTLDQVHAAADKLIEAFNQSSILIQQNPTTTEFYYG